MSCTKVKQSVEFFALGALTRGGAAEIAAHIKACSACRAVAAEAQTIAQLLWLAATPVEPSPALRRRLLAMAREEAYPWRQAR